MQFSGSTTLAAGGSSVKRRHLRRRAPRRAPERGHDPRPAVRAELCDRLAAAGVPRVEAVSFVNPKRVPQMAGAEEVMAAIDRARRARSTPASCSTSAATSARSRPASTRSTTPSRSPTSSPGATRTRRSPDAIETSAGSSSARADDGMRITVTLSVAFGCPFEGAVDPERVLEIAERVAATGPTRSSSPTRSASACRRRSTRSSPAWRALGATVGCHFHNTRNTGLRQRRRRDRGRARPCSTPRSAGRAGARSPRARRATSPPRTSSTCCTGWARDRHRPRRAHRARVWLGEQLGKELPGQLHKAGTFAPVAG